MREPTRPDLPTPSDGGGAAPTSRDPYLEYLRSRQAADGGWPYQAGQPSGLEPTAFALLAFHAGGEGAGTAARGGLKALERWQTSGGGFSVQDGAPPGPYATALAMVALLAYDCGAAAAEVARRWLIRSRSETISGSGGAYGHDTRLAGWSWVEGTYGWVEPTAWAVRALRSCGDDEHPRVREGLSMLFDRTVDGGGWNYGNVEVLGRRLAAQPETTGVVLMAVSGISHPSIERALDYLADESPRVRSPWSMAWARLGLVAHRRSARPIAAFERRRLGVNDTLNAALLRLASAPREDHPLLSMQTDAPSLRPREARP